MPLSDANWRLIREESRPGPMQMALDEIAAETAAEDDLRTLRVYRWTPSTLSLGYHQEPATVDWEYCEREGITVTRRPTGGGAIYHDDWGDISYSLAAPAEELPGDLMDTYERLCEPLFDALDALGVDASFAEHERPAVHEPACYLRAVDPAHDVVAGDGRKLSGNAQYRQRDAVIQHGSLTFERTPERTLSCFSGPDTAAETVEERVASVRECADVTRDATVDALESSFERWADADVGGWTDGELARARDRAREKYENPDWVRDGEAPT